MSQARADSAAHPPILAWLPNLPPFLWVTAVVLAVAAAALPGIWTAAGLIALLLCAVLLMRPDLAVYALALSVPLGSMLEVKLNASLSVSPTEGLAGILALGWAMRALARRKVVIPFTPLSVPLAAMVAMVAISAYQATDLGLTAKELLKWLELALVYLYVIAEMDSPTQAKILLGFLFAGAAIEGMIGLVQFALGLGPETFAIGRFMRAYGTFDQPNPYAGYLGMVIPLMAGFLLARPSKRARNVVLVVGLLAGGGVVASLSRGAWVGIALALGAMSLFWSRRSRILAAGGAIAAIPVAALAFLDMLPPEVTTRLAMVVDYFGYFDVRGVVPTPDNWAVIERIAHWQAALDMIAAHPLLGVGAGNYSAVYEDYMVQGWTESLGHAHNLYLNMAAELGIPGMLVYLVLLAVAAIHVMKWLVRSERFAVPGHQLLWRGILLGVLGTLVASAVHNMFDNLFVHGMSIQLGMALALAQLSASAMACQIYSAKGQPIP